MCLFYPMVINTVKCLFAKTDIRIAVWSSALQESRYSLSKASALLTKIAKENNVEQVSHSGGYTPDGLEFIYKKVKHDYEPAVNPKVARPDCGAMDFVADWNNRYIHGS